MLDKKTVILNRLAEGRKDLMGYHRFLNNESVDFETIISSLTARCSEYVSGRDIICVQDTTEYNFQSHSARINEGELGPVGNNKDIGFFAHPMLAIDVQEEFCVGFGSIQLWYRSYEKGDKYSRRYQGLPIEQKESYRWISSAEATKENLSQARHITILGDRESDISEFLDRVPDEKTDLIIRSRDNRKLFDQEDDLFEHLAGQTELGQHSLLVRENKQSGRSKHKATLCIKTARVKIKRPAKLSKQMAHPFVELTAIEVVESPETVKPGEPPVRWVLLTTSEVNDFEQACEVVRKYTLRWQIEQLFRISKRQGVNLEASQLETGRGLMNLGALALQVSMQILQLTQARDNLNNVGAEIAFTQSQIVLLSILIKKYEGKTAKQKNPNQVGSIAWASWIISRMGGWKGYRSQSTPGPITIFRGLEAFNKMFELYEFLQKDM